MSNSMGDLRATIESTLAAFFESYTLAARHKDASLISTTLSTDCKRYLKPSSFTAAYPFVKAVETNAEYEARMRPEIATLEEARFKILESVIDPAKRKASASTECWLKMAGTDPTTMEICWYLDFTDDGKKISRVVEFIDTATSAKVIEYIMKHVNKEIGTA
ncbi:hypothetical protein GGS26DRAFT_438160 [Hypomontagnella submonticulosa]|nr:hypothetical protein GGS26DRAFT_438160 [Hypomontagnella submonticulosa]